MAEKDVRFGFVWTKAEADALKEWCWANRVKSESAAVRAMVADAIKRLPPVAVLAETRAPKPDSKPSDAL